MRHGNDARTQFGHLGADRCDPATGKYGRVVRSVQANGKREAKTALARLEVEVRAGHVVAKDPTFNELLDRWIAHVRALGRSDATLYHYERYIVREIKPVFGVRRLSKLTTYDIDRFYAAWTRACDRTTDPRHHAGFAHSGRAVGPRRSQRGEARLVTVAAAAGAASAVGR